MAERRRLDAALVEEGLAPSRSQARRLVLAGQVRADGQVVDKPGTALSEGVELTVDSGPPFVSRGGEKIDPVLEAASIEVRDRIALDIGASTGGFTDALLQRGARAVVAVDVGYGQLDWKLRQDERVTVLERTNARHLTPDQIPGRLAGRIELVVMDVSFISVTKVLPALGTSLSRDCEALVLVKPQFEAGPERVEKGGVVRSAETRRDVLRTVAEAARDCGWCVLSAWPSPLRGPAGNWECFLYLRRSEGDGAIRVELDALSIPDDRSSSQDPSR